MKEKPKLVGATQQGLDLDNPVPPPCDVIFKDVERAVQIQFETDKKRLTRMVREPYNRDISIHFISPPQN